MEFENNDISKKSIAKRVLTSFFKKTNLKNLGYLPRWIILAIDVTLVLFATLVTHVLLDGIGIDFDYLTFKKASLTLSIYLIVQIFYFWRFRTYSGIIRHSSVVDMIQIFITEFAALCTLYLINIFFLYTNGTKLFLTTSLVITIVLSYFFLLAFRLLVKTVFDQVNFFTEKKKKENVLIYGSDDFALAIAKSILQDKSNKFKVVGFINPKVKSGFNKLLNIPVYNIKRKPYVIARKLKVNTLILADNELNNEERLNLIDECINYNLKLLTLPPFTDINEVKNISSKIRNIKIEDLLERKPIKLDSQKISEQIDHKVVLISGAAGSIGSEIVSQVIKYNPAKIILLDQAESPLHEIGLEISKINSDTEIHLQISDIRNRKTLEQIFLQFKPDIVYHAAAYKHVPLMEINPHQAVETNVIGTKNLADLSIQHGIKRFVMVSTDKAVNPSNVMGCSKRIAEKYVQSLAIYLKQFPEKGCTKFITTRFGNVLGSNGSVVPLFTKQIENGGPITITHPDIIRYFMTIPEACQLVLEAGAMGNGGEIYIFDMGKPVKIIDLAQKMIKLAGLVPDKDISIKIVGLRPGEKLYEELLNDSAKTLPTYHEKIMIALDIHEEYQLIQQHIHDLIELTQNQDKLHIVRKMKEIVPEYKSLNSEYQKLDI